MAPTLKMPQPGEEAAEAEDVGHLAGKMAEQAIGTNSGSAQVSPSQPAALPANPAELDLIMVILIFPLNFKIRHLACSVNPKWGVICCTEGWPLQLNLRILRMAHMH